MSDTRKQALFICLSYLGTPQRVLAVYVNSRAVPLCTCLPAQHSPSPEAFFYLAFSIKLRNAKKRVVWN